MEEIMKVQFLKDELQLSDEIIIRYAQDSEIIERLKKYIQEIFLTGIRYSKET